MSVFNSKFILGAVTGALIVVGGSYFIYPKDQNPEANQEAVDANKPLYWVAPMDSNYRRDKPGKSPMGMDLVPVYADGEGTDDEVGTIKISPNVVNNLGVRTATAEIRSLHNQIKTVGYIVYDEDRLVHIHPRVKGWIDKLFIKAAGEPVTKGQPLYRIYSPELVNAQEELLLALDRKNKRLIQAAENRLLALQLPKSVIDAVKSKKVVQQSVTFFAPQNGVVENLKIREGFYVQPGSTIMSIGDLSEVWVEAEIFERQASQVVAGTPTTMTLDYLPGKEWQGEVDYVYPILDPQTRTVKVRIRLENVSGKFKPNMFAQIVMHTQGSEEVLLIPKEALIRTGNQDRVVLALGEGKFKSIEVSIGVFDSEHVEILSGLTEGDEVVSSAQFLLDSESSKSSDFKRMNFHEMDEHAGHMMEMNTDKPSSATVNGLINSVMGGHRMVNISRDAIEKWDRPAATMDFMVDESIAMESFVEGETVNFTFEIIDGEFIIVDVQKMDMEDHSHHTNQVND